jgi:hypothetical protein
VSDGRVPLGLLTLDDVLRAVVGDAGAGLATNSTRSVAN